MLARPFRFVRLGVGFVAATAALGCLEACGGGDDNTAPVPSTPSDGGAKDASLDAPSDATVDGTLADSPSDAPHDAPSDAADAGDAHVLGDGGGLSKINHFVVVYMENHSFDNLYGEFPGANGLSSLDAGEDAGPVPHVTQQTTDGAVYDPLPFSANDMTVTPAFADADVANAPFPLESFTRNDQLISDLPHLFFTEQFQINDGGMNQFVFFSTAQGLAMGHWHTMKLPVPVVAKQFTVCDNFFHAAFGGSFLNHFWLIAARTPEWANAPGVDAGGPTVDDPAVVLDTAPVGTEGQVTLDGFVVNTSFSVNSPHPLTVAPTKLVPNQTFDTIGERLNEVNVSWAWYAGGWNDALRYSQTDGGSPTTGQFQFHHQPFVYFAKYADGTPGRAQHLKDETEFMTAAQNGTLPAVSFVKPVGDNNEHPGYTDELTGEQHLLGLIQAVETGPNWDDTAIIVTYDEHGGQWDHVPPPHVDRWGPGSRVPTIVISKFAKKNFVDSTQYDTTSILKTIEVRYGLTNLTTRDLNVRDMSAAFDFTSN
jgi:acid phosphatase